MPGPRVHGSGNGPVVPLSRRELRRTAPGAQFGPMYEFLNNFTLRDTTLFEDDFTNVTLDATNDYFVAAGASSTTWAILNSATVAGADGLLRGVVGGTAATSGLQLFRPVCYSGDKNCGIEAYFQTSIITQKRFEIGFVNAMPSVNTLITNSVSSSPSFNTVTDAAVAVFDKGAATVTSGLYTLNSDGATAQRAVFTSQVLAVSTFIHVRVEVKTDSAFLWVNGALVASITGADASGAIEGGTALVPCFMSAKSADTNACNLDIDYVRVYGDRVTQA
jgi:hypothetical protein